MTSREKQQQLRRRRRQRQRTLIKGILLLLLIAVMVLGIFWGYRRFLSPKAADPLSVGKESSAAPTTATPTTRARSAAVPTVQMPVVLQNPELPTGCESTAAAMLLQAYGYQISKTDVANALPKSRLTKYNGRVYAAHPNDAFIGNPFSGGSDFGVFAGALAATMQSLIDQAGGQHTVKNITGADEATILSLIDRKVPVCIWATMDMSAVRQGSSGWYLMDGDAYTDTWFSWPGYEHCLVLVGRSDTTVTVHDPLRGKVEYNRTLFFTRYADLGSQAIILESY